MRIPSAVRAVFGLEIRSLLRDPRTVFVSVVLPVLLIPAILLASNWVEDRRAEREDTRIYRFDVTGSEAAFALDLIAPVQHAGPDRAGSDVSAEGLPQAEDAGGRFRRVSVADHRAALEADSLDFYVEAFTRDEWRAQRPDTAGTVFPHDDRAGGGAHDEDRARTGTSEADQVGTGASEAEVAGEAGASPGEPGAARDDLVDEAARVLRIRFLAPRTGSREGASELRRHLLETRQARRDSIVLDAGFPVAPERVASTRALDVASDEEVQGARLGRFLTMILVGLMLLGGSAVATDTLAGEKERGTLETLLTSAASRGEIIWGKLLAIMAVALAIALIQVINLWVFLGLGLLDTGGGFAVSVTPGIALGLLVLYLPAVALTAGLLLLMSAYARSYKEAQLYLTPVLLLLILPTLAPFLPDLSLRSAALAVPLANISLAARDLLIGEIHLPLFALSWLVTAGAAAWVAARSVRTLHDETLVTGETSREEFLGGPELWQKRVLRWFLVFWALKILLDFNLALDDIRVAAFVSVGVFFLAIPLVVIRYFRLDPVEALALRMPRPGVWAGVALGVPAALVAMTTLFRLVDFILPMPTELMENFGQALMPEGIPLWQLVFFIAVIPGIVEELTFRGVLLHGLRKRFGPVGLALVVGLIFGIFHFQLFRIPVTAALGVVLSLVTILTGSIFPAIAWHMLNNALAVLLGARGIELDFDGWWIGIGAFLLLGVALRIIWAYRTPYPEVGENRPRRQRRG